MNHQAPQQPDRASVDSTSVHRIVADFQRDESAIRAEVGGVIVGQQEPVAQILTVLLSGGHALIQGVPGTGKTLLVQTIARAVSMQFRRVQFTPDLLPADILGYDTLIPGPGGVDRIEFREGPIFTQFLLADEINRGTPRTQSALLEAMQERQVTIASGTRPLDPLLTVFATRNPIEMEGTYPLPEAQLDRFQMQIELGTPSAKELIDIAERTTAAARPPAHAVVSAARIAGMREEVRTVIAAPPLLEYAARLVRASQPDTTEAPAIVREQVRYGAGVRALQSLILAAKVAALRAGRFHIGRADLEAGLLPVLRHRLILSLEGEARGTGVAEVAAEILRSAAAARPPDVTGS